jgi:hypothetical protein
MKKNFVALVLVGVVAALSGQPVTAATHHDTRKATRLSIPERVRNVRAYYPAPAVSSAPVARYYDEALAPPAGH